jgi:hypothetical protein
MNPDRMNPDRMNPDRMNPERMNPDRMIPDRGRTVERGLEFPVRPRQAPATVSIMASD